MKKIDIGFGVEIETFIGEEHTSYDLRNNICKLTTKLGRIKNGIERYNE